MGGSVSLIDGHIDDVTEEKKCTWYAEYKCLCTNADCSYYAEWCPISGELGGICRFEKGENT